MQRYGRTTDVLDLEPLVYELRSFSFVTEQVDGHDVDAFEAIFKKLPFKNDSPSGSLSHSKGQGAAF